MSLLLIVGLAMVAWALGFLAFHAAPILEGALDARKRVSNLHLWLCMFAINKAAIVVQEDGQLLWKKMGYSELNYLAVDVGGRFIPLQDVDNALSTWMGSPFTLADEVHGMMFDPRHAFVGGEKEDARERGDLIVRATDGEWDRWNVYGWVRAVFEVPAQHSMVALERVRHLVSGDERAEDRDHTEEFYKLSRNPSGSQTSLIRLLVPPLVFLGTLVVFWQISTRSGGSGGEQSGTTVGFTLAAIATPDVREWAEDHAATLAGLVVIGLVLVGLVAMAGLLLTVVLVVSFGMGFFALPALAMLLGLLNAGGLISKLLLWLGLMGYQDPVFVWTQTGYELRERSELDDPETVPTYRLGSSWVGFTFEPGAESFGPEQIDHAEIEERQPARADGDGGGGKDGIDTNLPTSQDRAPWIRRGSFGGFVPRRIDDAATYINSGVAAARMKHAATGGVANLVLQNAKEKFGDGDFGMSDKMLLYSTFAAMILATIVGWGIFL